MKTRQGILRLATLSAVVSALFFASQSVGGLDAARKTAHILGPSIEAGFKEEISDGDAPLRIPLDDLAYLRKTVYLVPLCIVYEQRSALVFVLSLTTMWFCRKRN